MTDSRLRKAGFAATLVTGACLLGGGLHGVVGLDSNLRAAAAPLPAPRAEPSPELVREQWHPHECDGPVDRRI